MRFTRIIAPTLWIFSISFAHILTRVFTRVLQILKSPLVIAFLSCCHVPRGALWSSRRMLVSFEVSASHSFRRHFL